MRFFLFLLVCTFPLLGSNQIPDFVVLSEKNVHSGNYFAFGEKIEVSGLVQGDVYALGSKILVDGRVEGDLIVVGGFVEITGQIGGSVWATGGKVTIEGAIQKGLNAIGGNVRLKKEGSVGGNIVIMAGLCDLVGFVGGGATITASTTRLRGEIEGNIEARVEKMQVESGAKLGGTLLYKSPVEAKIDPGAQIAGAITFKEAPFAFSVVKKHWQKRFAFGFRILSFFMHFIYSFAIGWILIKYCPHRLQNALETLNRSRWKSFWVGLLVIFLLPLACLLLFITVLGFPLAIGLLALSILSFYAAKILPILWVTHRCFSNSLVKRRPILLMGLGVFLFLLVSSIPFLGRIMSIFFTLLGLGAIFIGRFRQSKKKITQ